MSELELSKINGFRSILKEMFFKEWRTDG